MKLQVEQFKIVYIAPMKSLVNEMVLNFKQRLAYLNLTIQELSGDVNLSYDEILQTQIIITTPEKWEIITRKYDATQGNFLSLIKLMIIDEIHLLHDERGPVLESIISRIIRLNEKVSIKYVLLV